MNKKVMLFLVVLLLSAGFSSALEVEFFYGQGCPHCAAAESWLDEHAAEYNVSVVTYEVYHNQSNALLLQERLAALGERPAGVPTFIVENHTVLVGWSPRVRAALTGSPPEKESLPVFMLLLLALFVLFFVLLFLYIMKKMCSR